jgi:hypothetical protein
LWTRIVVVAIAGALGAALANRGVAAYHDGLRPVMPELREGRIQRREFIPLAFGLSFGLVVGFGLPFSLLSAILLVHCLWLGTDVIGTWFPGPFERDPSSQWQRHLGLIGASAVGALYGGLLSLGLEGFRWLLEHLPVPISDSFGLLLAPVVFTFAAFPAIAVAYQHGVRRGILAFLITLAARQAASALGLANPDSWALGVGMAIFIVCAIREKSDQGAGIGMATPATDRVKRIRRYLPAIAVLGAVYGLACNQAILMEGPQSSAALAQGDRVSAASFTLARALSFTPLKAMSALTSGVFAMDGLGFVATVGLASPNAVVAAISGALVISVEALSLTFVGRFLDRFPGMLKSADSARWAMTKLLEVAALVGGMMAANNMAPGLGFIAVAGLYLLNEAAGAPIVRVAIGPVGVILVGIVINVLALLQFGPPA